MSNYDPPYGYGLRRNGTCLASEEDCGNPWGDWYNCCPENTHCSANNTCCPTDSDCSVAIAEDPHCANNATWDLYDSEGYFCCLSSSNGFLAGGLEFNGSETTGVGCADGYPEGESNSVLLPVARGTASASTSASATPSATGSPTNTPTTLPESDSDKSSNNTGAIVGGVIGGCAGLTLIAILAWFLWRRRRQQKAASSAPLMNPGAVGAPPKEAYGVYGPEQGGVYEAELDNNVVRAELYGGDNSMAHELPATSMRQ
ncbi:uncharacterized protein BDV17DRAFT_286598 [Aspergillus undulatus]|uniref:Epidermal growth factor receptor-like transmembrane-juxtamembrane segment domain-containing protein n=1 Tax=Emericella variicolor TaxID=1549217 RepID=A0A1V1FTA3_EMEVA|nr:hypothetical protein [Aspergillus stellatus]